jgi:hypothetical protein
MTQVLVNKEFLLRILDKLEGSVPNDQEMKYVINKLMSIISQSDKETTIEVYCRAMGQQGGTIHDALRAFAKADKATRDRVYDALMDAYRSKQLNDVDFGFLTEFTRIYNEATFNYKELSYDNK